MALCNPHIVRGSVCAALPAPAKLGSRASAVCRGALPGPSCRPRGAVRSARRDVRVLAAETGACRPHGALPKLCRADVCSVFLGRGPTSLPTTLVVSLCFALTSPSCLPFASPEDADAELEKRLAAFKGTRDWKDVRAEREKPKSGAEASAPGSTPSASAPVSAETWSGETVFYEGPPSRGDLAVNLLLGTTLLWLVRTPERPRHRGESPADRSDAPAPARELAATVHCSHRPRAVGDV